MLISDLIKKLQDFQKDNGDLKVQLVVPEGPYARLESTPDVFGIGYSDSEGEYHSEKPSDDDEDEMELDGPFFCIGGLSYE